MDIKKIVRALEKKLRSVMGSVAEKPMKRKNFLDVYSIQDGEVVDVIRDKANPSYGISVIVRVKDKNNKSFFVRYAHLKSTNLKPTNKLKKNDVIGTMGKTGTELVHCHVSIYEDDPNIIKPNKEKGEYSGIDNGRKINIFTYLKENDCVWPTNTQISGGHCQSYDFYLRTMWYPHEGGDFSGWDKIPGWENGLPGDGYYNDDNGQHEKNRELYDNTKAKQWQTFKKLKDQWLKIGGLSKLEYNLNGYTNKNKEFVKGVNIVIKEIEDEIEALKAKTDDKDHQKEIDTLVAKLEEQKEYRKELKTLAGKLQRVGSIKYAEILNKQLTQEKNIKEIEEKIKEAKAKYEKAVADYKKVLNTTGSSNKLKYMYDQYVESLKAKLAEGKNNLENIKKSLNDYAEKGADSKIQAIGVPDMPDYNKVIMIDKKLKDSIEESFNNSNDHEDNDDADYSDSDDSNSNQEDNNNKHGTSGNSGNHQDNNSQGGNTGNSNGNIGNGGTQKPKPGSGSTTPNNPGNGGGTGGNNGTTPKPDDPPSGGGGGRDGEHENIDIGSHGVYRLSTNTENPGLGEYYIDRIRSNPLSAGTKPIGYYTEQRNNTPSLQNTVNIGFAGSTSNDISIKEDEGLSTGNEWV